jgi:ATP adenylyltransferase
MAIENHVRDSGRFAFLNSLAECPRPIYDQILFESHGCVITPTLGSILPNWLLIVPRSKTLNFQQWSEETGESPMKVVKSLIAKYAVSKGRVLWFEHGPARTESVLGCGVDQAHLHLIYDAPFSAADLRLTAARSGKLDWFLGKSDSIYASIRQKGSYLMVGSEDTAGCARDVEHVGSQFLRKVIACMVDQPDTWNYRTHPHLANVRETIRTFCSVAN